MSEFYSNAFKVILLGDGGVGKTSMIERFINDSFNFNTPHTVGAEYYAKTINIQKEKVLLNIWDTAGQERYRSIIPSYFKGAKGVVLVYDICSKNSFSSLNYWINQVKQFAEDAAFMLIGNKADLEDTREVLSEEALKLAKRFNMLFFETSCSTALNIQFAFYEFGRHLLESNTLMYDFENQKSLISPLNGKFSVLTINTAKEEKKRKRCCI